MALASGALTPITMHVSSSNLFKDRICGSVQSQASRILFCIPKPPLVASVDAIAFPGDGVEWPFWPTPVTGTAVTHPHSGGLLGMIHNRLKAGGGSFEPAAVFVVEPRACVDRYAMYNNLLPVELTERGEPIGEYDGSSRTAASTLAQLIEAAYKEAGVTPPDALPLLAFGFSKAGIVLNQLLAEAAGVVDGDDDDGSRLLGRLSAVHYLDAGLAREGGAHLTDEATIEALGRRPRRPTVAFHGTPRQWRDETKPWLRGEMEASAASLKKAGVDVTQHEYFTDEPLSLAMHFACVESFELGAGPG